MVEKVKLGDICDVRDGTHDSPHYVQSGFPLITSKNIKNGEFDLTGICYISEEDLLSINKRSLVDDGDILLPMIGTIGNPIIVKKTFEFAIKNVALIKFNPINPINNKYIYYLLKSQQFISYVSKENRGGNQKFLSLKDIRDFNFSLLSMDKQQKIVKVLDTISGIIEMRKQQIAKLDELEKSLFIEMFGDPVTNPMGWEDETWGNIFTVQTGKLDSNAMVLNGKYPFFTCSKESYRINTYAFDCEALLLAGNNASGDYDVKYYNGKFNAYQRTYVLTVHNSNFTYSFLKRILNFKLSWLKQSSKGTNTKYLTKKILESISIVSPPIDLQILYEKKILDIAEKKRFLDDSICIVNKLYNATMKLYFND